MKERQAPLIKAERAAKEQAQIESKNNQVKVRFVHQVKVQPSTQRELKRKRFNPWKVILCRLMVSL